MQNAVPFNAFDEEFNLNLKIAKVLLENLTGQEKDIAVNWLRRLSNLQTNEISVKKDRNHFLRKLLAVIKQSVFLKVLNHPRYQLLSSREKMLMKCTG
ncbi:hypothetical protein O3M35_006431 [Rhynocoris fuscipes]|uniref:DUF4485 domain-containing protein n=1 Tax=Rhynocoris fuscipes TaxID=488301 RepID=A0AAW1DDD7_9HEMI